MNRPSKRSVFQSLSLGVLATVMLVVPQLAWGGTQAIKLASPATYPAGVTAPTVKVTKDGTTFITVTSTAQTLVSNSTYTISVTNNDGTGNYQLQGVSVDGGTIQTCGANCGTFATANSNQTHTIAVYFKSKVVATTVGSGSITNSGTNWVNYNTAWSTVITPTTGYDASLNDNNGTTSTVTNYYGDTTTFPVTYTISASTTPVAHTVTVTFSAHQSTITPSAGANGSISPNTAGTYSFGQTPTPYAIQPNTCYAIDTVTVNGAAASPAPPTNGDAYIYAFPAITKSTPRTQTIAATFKDNPNYSISTSCGPNGTITPGASFPCNSSASVDITPNNGYYVDTVTLDGNPYTSCAQDGSTCTITFNPLIANHTITAIFAVRTFTIIATQGANGTITPAGTTTVNHNQSQTYTIRPDAGYDIASVTIDGVTNVTGSLVNNGDGSWSYTFNSVTSNRTITASFTRHAYTITTLAVTVGGGTGGTITPTFTVLYQDNGQVTYTANVGYHISSVMVDGVDQGQPAPGSPWTFTGVGSDHSITVYFSRQWTIVASAGAGGAISPSGNVTVDHGSNQTFTVTPSANYQILSILVDGTPVAITDPNAATPYTFYGITGNRSITASFIRIWNVTLTAGANGSISPSGTVKVRQGDSLPFTVTPSTNYLVQDVTIDGGSVGAVTNYTLAGVSADHTVNATFVVKATHTIRTYACTWYNGMGYNMGDTYGGTITPINPTVYDGDSQTFTLTPRTSPALYALRGIFLDCTNCTNGTNVGSTSPYTLSNITGNHNLCVRFRPADYTITATAGPNGTITPSGTIPVSSVESQDFIIAPNPGYDIDQVTVDGVDKGAVSTYTFPNPQSSNHTINATFKEHVYTLTATAGPNGTITPSGVTNIPFTFVGTKHYDITPDPGYMVKDVKVNGISNGALTSYDFQFSGSAIFQDQTIAAEFMARNLYTVTVTAGAGGSVTSNTGVNSAWQGDSLIYTIAPNAGYNVGSVTVDGVAMGPITSYTFNNIQANHTLNVVFVAAHTIIATAGVHGTITPAGSVKVTNGDSKTFIITPDSGYNIFEVYVDGVRIDPAPSRYTFSNVTGDHTISVTFVTSGSGMSNYCNVPPFIAGIIRPNLLLLIDNSSSMYDLAYTTSSTYCYDESYDDAFPYVGYFERSTFYTYDAANNKFYSTASLPDSCTFRTGYVCVNMTGTSPTRVVDTFVASGKFLNWLSASKLDIQKQALTGGKFDTTYNVLQAESRGCLGRRYLKAVPVLPGLTFAVRGPGSFEADFTNPATQGGQTRIEIYDATYNKAACLAAVNDWQTGAQMGTTQNDTRACIGTGPSALKTAAYNQMIHDCYWVRLGHAASNLNALQGNCEDVYTNLYSNDPSQITSSTAGDAVCSSVLTHPPMNNNGQPNSTGYLGKCYGGSHNNWDATCSVTETHDFCAGVDMSGVTDPSDAPYVESSSYNVPAFLMDAGVNALGNVAASYLVRVAQAAAPKGLIEEFKNSINFGAMTFNFTGAGSELDSAHNGTLISQPRVCSNATSKQCFSANDCPAGGSCDPTTPLDGGKVISRINVDQIGDHDVGLIHAIDSVQATSWTPHAEALYSAIGYFAQNAGLRINATDFEIGDNVKPIRYSCQKNNILLISDGMSTADRNASVTTLANLYKSPSNQTTAATTSWSAAPSFAGSINMDDLAWLAWNKKITDFTTTPTTDSERIKTHVVYTGVACPDKDGLGVCTATDEKIPEVEMQHTASYGGGLYTLADNTNLTESLRRTLLSIAVQGSSGTAASILSNSEGSGANILQAIFYPQKTFDTGLSSVNWIGELQDFWYYVDPYIGNSTVREDTNQDRQLDLLADYEARFWFDTSASQTQVDLFQDLTGSGLGTVYKGTVLPDNVKSLWKGGQQLWSRSSSRTIYTQLSGSLIDLNSTAFDTNNASVRGLMQATDKAEADRIVSFTYGTDYPGVYRNRTIATSNLPSAPKRVWPLGDIISSTPRIQSNVRLGVYDIAYQDLSYAHYLKLPTYRNRGMAYVGANDGMLHAFKMGRLVVTPEQTGDESILRDSTKAILRGNNLGEEQWNFVPKNAVPYLKYLADKDYTHLYFVDGSISLFDVSMGDKDASNVKLSRCTTDYYWDCDKKNSSTNSWYDDGLNWRTVLVGSMGLGGASRDKDGSCNDTDGINCVKTPVSGLGYSSYFALDVTNQTFHPTTGALQGQPTFLWEFTDPELGYSMSGPAVVKINARVIDGEGNSVPDPNKNGRWFVVFASGPTGPIDSNACQFKGGSDQELKLFVIDLHDGPAGGVWRLSTGLTEAFAGSITNGVADSDRFNPSSRPGYYQDEVVYIPYVKKAGDGTWTDGGVLRLLTREDPNPNNWVVTKLIEGIGPVTTNVAKLQDMSRKVKDNDDNPNTWVFFGTGRYYYGNDDRTGERRIFGIKEPCYDKTLNHINPACAADTDSSFKVQLGELQNQTSDPQPMSCSISVLTGEKVCPRGWYINLSTKSCSINKTTGCIDNSDCPRAAEGETCTDLSFGTERATTDPVALGNGTVLFTTFMPTTDSCKFGGNSYMWGVKHNTGMAPASSALKGKALVQVSTGSFVQVDLSTAFTAKDGRKMGSPMVGKPPSDPPPIVSNSELKPVKKIIHIEEK